MEKLVKPQDLELMAVLGGISMTKASQRAGLQPAVFFRWKAGKSSPSLKNVEALRGVLLEAVALAEESAACPDPATAPRHDEVKT